MQAGPAAPRLGILGGSFDPPHVGHLVLASCACEQLGLRGVLFVPAAEPPHKAGGAVTPAPRRLELTRLAIAGDDRFAVSAVELEAGVRFTRDTLAELARRLPGERFVFLMGADSLVLFETWHDPAGILTLCTLGVAPRPGDDLRQVEAARTRLPAGSVELVDMPVIGVSSTMIRDRVARGRDVRYLVPAAVEARIRELGLYAAHA